MKQVDKEAVDMGASKVWRKMEKSGGRRQELDRSIFIELEEEAEE